MKPLAFAVALIISFAASAVEPVDSVNVLFRLGGSEFNPSLADNGPTMERFIQSIQEANAAEDIDSIVIRAYASPDGTNRINALLSRQRCEAIADVIRRQTQVPANLIHTIPEGIAWAELRNLVANTPDVPSREKVLRILDTVPLTVRDSRGNIVSGRKKQLMDLDGGRTYKWLYANLFPQLRNAMAVVLYRTPKAAEEPTPEPEPTPEIEAPEAVEVVDAVIPEPAPEVPSFVEKSLTDSRFALKTNMLFYAILMPNLELEWMCADRWSIALEGQGAWYAKEDPHKVYRLATLTPEVRYWPIERTRWHGMYVGAFVGGGLYDLCNGKKGHEGEGVMAGVSAGYMWPISKHLSLDAGLGIGYMRARDKVYMPLDGHCLYQLTQNVNYFGPLRLKLSLVWRIPYKTVKQ